MGASIAGFFQSNKSEQTKNLTPHEKELNQYKVNQFANTDQLSPDFYQGMNNVFQYGNQADPGVQYYYGLATGEGFNKPAFDTGQWANTAINYMDYSPYSQNMDQRTSNTGTALDARLGGIQGSVDTNFSNLSSNLDTRFANQANNLDSRFGNFSSQLDNRFSNIDQSLQGMGNDLFQTGNSYYNNIVGPQIGSEYSLMGLGRSGGRQEAEAKGAASIALPIQQQITGLRNNAMMANAGYQNQAALTNLGYQNENALANMGYQNQAMQAHAGYQNQNAMTNLGYQNQAYAANNAYQNQFQAQRLNNLYGLNMAMPGVDTQTRDAQLQRMIAAAPLTDYGRTARLQGNTDFSNLWLSALNATPFTQGTGTSTKGSSWGVSGQASAKVPGFG